MVESLGGVVKLCNRVVEGFDHTVLAPNHEVKASSRMVEPFDHALLLSSRDALAVSLYIRGLQTMRPNPGNVRFYRSTASRYKSGT